MKSKGVEKAPDEIPDDLNLMDPLILQSIKLYTKSSINTASKDSQRLMDLYISLRDSMSLMGEYKETGNDTTTIQWDDHYTFCEFQSISNREFYQAQSTGLKPEMTLKLSLFDYQNESYVKYEDEVYTVLKTNLIKDNTDEILLTLTRGIKDVSA